MTRRAKRKTHAWGGWSFILGHWVARCGLTRSRVEHDWDVERPTCLRCRRAKGRK